MTIERDSVAVLQVQSFDADSDEARQRNVHTVGDDTDAVQNGDQGAGGYLQRGAQSVANSSILVWDLD